MRSLPWEVTGHKSAGFQRRRLGALALVATTTFTVLAPGLGANAVAADSGDRVRHPADNVQVLDSHHLRVGAGCPSDRPGVKVMETRTTVRIRVTYTATAFACLRIVGVTLKSPLGERRIVDATTGHPIPAAPGDSADSAVPPSTPRAALTVVRRLPFDGAVAVATSVDGLFVLRAEGIAAGGGVGWRLDRVDPASGAILGTARGDAEPVDVAVGFNSVWVLTGVGAKGGGLGPGLDRLDAVSLAPEARIALQDAGTRIWLTGSAVWLAHIDGLFAIDPQTNAVARELPGHHEFISFASTSDRLLLATRATGSDGKLHVKITWIDEVSLRAVRTVEVASSSADSGVPPYAFLAPVDEDSVLVGLLSIRDGDSLVLVTRDHVTGSRLDGGAIVAASSPDGFRWAARDEPAPPGSVTARVSQLQAISSDGHVAGTLDGLGLITCLSASGNLVYACADNGVVVATR